MSSVRAVAKKAGVSIATVSRVLNGSASVTPELRNRVLEVAATCDYAPTVGKIRASRIGLLYMDEFWLSSPYDSACIDGMGKAMRRSIYDFVILDFRRDRQAGEPLRQFLSRKGVSGAVVRSRLEFRGELVELAREGAPLVVLGDHFDCEQLRFVYAASSNASREAVEHLVSLGHKRIAFVGCDRDDGDHSDRMEAYREVLSDAGLFCDRDVYRVPPHRMDGSPLARRILSKADRPTAMFIADPLLAVGIVNEAHQMGVRVPEDLSVIGFDDSDTRNSVYPRMSAVCQDSSLIGELAFDAVRELCEGEPNLSSSTKQQEAWFEIHETTAPPPQKAKAFLPRSRSSD
ncbi:Catabolite control protein A [Pirellulimonas nuda]|uniref:Catabolite control protein A n=1 Tax=Pirellulimonas nuda TaxID=2528009 RepID=A0A518D911_9BACT|nr:LacI family DNA-binding transcriptional regulator [Pirellulimonas nuda]QDU87963.1 Catabolite control protein A [Pirellulimonas nuda]